MHRKAPKGSWRIFHERIGAVVVVGPSGGAGQADERYFSAAELVNLPGLPSTRPAVRVRAIRENWPSRERNRKGGGREYPLSALPKAAQKVLLSRLMFKPANPAELDRPWLTVVMDEKSRHILGVSSHIEEPGPEHIAQALLQAMQTHRLPARILIDRGREYGISPKALGRPASKRDTASNDHPKLPFDAPYFNAKELAGLSGMPGTERGVQRLAKRSGWPPHQRRARGGGVEYSISCLPEVTQKALFKAIEQEPSR